MIKRLIRTELYQIINSRIFYMMLFICCITSFFFTSIDYLLEPMVQNTPDSLLGIYMNSIADVGVALIIIAGCYSAFLFSEQFEQRTINLKIACGYSKTEIYLVQCLKTFFVVGLLIGLSVLFGCIKYGITDFAIEISRNAGYFIRTLVFIYFLAFAIVSFCIIFAVIFQNTTKTLIASFIFLFVSCYIMAAIVANFLASDNLSSAYDINNGAIMKFYPPYLWRWALNPELNASQIIVTLIIALAWGIFAVTIGCQIFKKKEFK